MKRSSIQDFLRQTCYSRMSDTINKGHNLEKVNALHNARKQDQDHWPNGSRKMFTESDEVLHRFIIFV